MPGSHDRTHGHDQARSALAVLVGAEIVKYRARHGLTQRQLGALLGIGQANTARLEAGRHEPSFATLDRLSSMLGIEVRVAFTPEGPRARVARRRQ